MVLDVCQLLHRIMSQQRSKKVTNASDNNCLMYNILQTVSKYSVVASFKKSKKERYKKESFRAHADSLKRK